MNKEEKAIIELRFKELDYLQKQTMTIVYKAAAGFLTIMAFF